MSTLSVYRKLFFNSVDFKGVDAPYGPNLICQACGNRFRDDKTTPALTNVVKDSRKRVFTCPKCGRKIELYIAVSRTEKGGQGIQISVNPIDPDWLEKEEASRKLLK